MPATPPPTPAKRESRILKASEVRASKVEGGFRVEGYAAKFGILSHDLGGFVETIKRGAFARAIESKQDVTFLWMHDRRTLMARVKSNTLKLEEDATGLKFDASICDCSDGRDLHQRMSRGDVDQMSFAFLAVRQSWDWAKPIPVRTLEDLDLFDVSAVDDGQYPETELSLRCFDDARAQRDQALASKAADRGRRLRLAEAEAADAILG